MDEQRGGRGFLFQFQTDWSPGKKLAKSFKNYKAKEQKQEHSEQKLQEPKKTSAGLCSG